MNNQQKLISIFINFLKKENCYHEFCINSGLGKDSIEKHLTKKYVYGADNWILDSFDFKETKQGKKYWENISQLWNNY
jgi:hypothetical protein